MYKLKINRRALILNIFNGHYNFENGCPSVYITIMLTIQNLANP